MMKSVQVEFTGKKLTGNAGLIQFGRFIQKLKLKPLLEHMVTIQRGENAVYQIADVALMIMLGVLAGAKHMSHVLVLRTDPVLRHLFNWEQFPVDSTFGRLVRLFTPRHCHELAEVEQTARQKVWGKRWRGRITFDFDSTVRGVYGHQEGAQKGYNPKKKGQASYHPLLCFIAETRECLHSWFRCGDAYSANGCVEFLKECYARTPKRVWKVWCRGDSAFFNGALLDLLEERHSYYTIKVAMKGLVKLLEAQSWRGINQHPEWEATVFFYRCAGWKRTRRFVAVRQRHEDINDEGLFPVVEVTYEYFCYVTNLSWSPWGIHRYYGQRATSENWIEWCKNQMAAGSILTQKFWANSALFQLCLLAYNLMVWLLWLTHTHGFTEEPNTLRGWLIHLPATLITRGRRDILKLPRDWWAQARWRQLDQALAELQMT